MQAPQNMKKTDSLGFQLIWIFLALFFIMFVTTSFVTGMVNGLNIGDRNKYLLGSAIQSVLCFIIPSLIIARIQSYQPLRILTLDVKLKWVSVVGIIMLFLLGQPVMNQIVYWNETVKFPHILKGVEDLFREWEENSAVITGVILGDESIYGLISGILIVGCLTGFAEEIFFRDGLQRLLGLRLNIHYAIWISAFIFSLMHFQFFGFIPRLLLGALFGYLFYWTGTIWASVLAHALNNSIVVVLEWLNCRGFTDVDYSMFGVTEYEFPLLATLSGIAVILFLEYCRIPLFKKTNHNKGIDNLK